MGKGRPFPFGVSFPKVFLVALPLHIGLIVFLPRSAKRNPYYCVTGLTYLSQGDLLSLRFSASSLPEADQP